MGLLAAYAQDIAPTPDIAPEPEPSPTPEATAAPAPQPANPAAVIATVNGEPVTQAQIELYFVQYMTYYGGEMTSDQQETFQTQATEQALTLALKGGLIRAMGRERNITPTPEQVRSMRGQMHEVMGLGAPDQVDALLKQRGIADAEVDTFIRTSLINSELFEEFNKDNPTTVTETMGRLFFQRNSELHHRPAQVRLRQIVVLAAGLNAEEKAAQRTKAEAALQRLREGADFAAVAAEVSDDPTAKQGGQYGWVKAADMEPPLAEAAFALKPGSFSDLVETNVGFHIVKVDAVRAEENLTYERVAPVLIPQMKYQLEKAKFQEWLDLQLSEAEIVASRAE